MSWPRSSAGSRPRSRRRLAPPGPPSYFEQQLAELKRIKDTGRQSRGTVTRHEATNRELFGSPVVMLHFDVEGRDIVFEHGYGWRHLKRYKLGRTVDVWIDPDNPRRALSRRLGATRHTRLHEW